MIYTVDMHTGPNISERGGNNEKGEGEAIKGANLKDLTT